MYYTTAPHPNAIEQFSPRILAWFATHGRHHLPWQQHHKACKDVDIYAVWLSEIMLQQTQVATVIGYFQRFIEQLPTVEDLAEAPWDTVANLWAGLGYYARARNLHTGAKQVVDFIEKNGRMPATVQEWQAIKGVGLSTAGAIVAMGVRERGVICDGNVKRVLTRWAGMTADITKSTTDKELWRLADALTPQADSGRYAQAMMDMGATICTRSQPKCQLCPISSDCVAYAQNTPTAYPVKAKKPPKPSRHSIAIRLRHHHQTLWIKRHSSNGSGIWEALWCLPLLTSNNPLPTSNLHALIEHVQACGDHHSLHLLSDRQILDTLMTMTVSPKPTLHTIKHTLTHFHWHITLMDIDIDDNAKQAIQHALDTINATYQWQDMPNLALPKAMHKLLAVSAGDV